MLNVCPSLLAEFRVIGRSKQMGMIPALQEIIISLRNKWWKGGRGASQEN